MADTIFYKGKLKRGKKPLEVFEKIRKAIKKKGPTKDWVCMVDEETEQLCITFPDGESENFILRFNEKGEFEDFCKVYFPLEGELFEEGKSEFKALLDALYRAKSMFKDIEIRDDYGLAESYWDSKRFKFDLRELTLEEKERVKRLYFSGYTRHENLLRAIMAEDLEMSVDELVAYRNLDIQFMELGAEIYLILESYLYETAEFQKDGRLCEMPDYKYYDLGKVSYSVFAFIEGLSWVFFDGTGYGTSINLEKKRAFSPKDAQVGLLFREKFAPLFIEEKDSLERCLLVYRYFVSVYDYLGFKNAGKCKDFKTVIDQILEQYGEEKGTIFLTFYCTTKRYVFKNFDQVQKERYGNQLVKNIRECYGEIMFDEYLDFKRKYQRNMRFRMETDYMAKTKMKYIDDSLIQ